jgi:hypothetical protein
LAQKDQDRFSLSTITIAVRTSRRRLSLLGKGSATYGACRDFHATASSECDPTLLDQLVSIEPEPSSEIDTKCFISMMQSAMDIFHEQKVIGNTKFMEKFIAANRMNQTLVEAVWSTVRPYKSAGFGRSD